MIREAGSNNIASIIRVKKSTETDSTELIWKQTGGLLYARNPKEDEKNPKIAGFDFDSTLSVTKSGLVFSKTPMDWKYLN